MSTATILSVIALALACFSLGMRVGRLLTLWEEKTKDSNHQGDERDA